MDEHGSDSGLNGKANETDYVIRHSQWRVRDIPERMRPREELTRLGVRHVADDVLVAVILRSGVRGTSVIDLARHLLRKYGSLSGIAASSVDELACVPGMGPVKAQVLISALEIGRRLDEESIPKRHSVKSPQDVRRILKARVCNLQREVFWVLPLDSKNRLQNHPIEVTSGLLDASLVHPREVFREAIRSAAAAVVLAHNHPSGDCEPSAEDIRITKQLVQAGSVVDIRVLDHVVIGDPNDSAGYRSMRESGHVAFV